MSNIKRKNKTERVNLLVSKEFIEKAFYCMGKYKTLTQVIEEALNGKFYNEFKTNDVEAIKSKQNREVVQQLIDQASNNSDINEAEELERLKAERRARKESDFND